MLNVHAAGGARDAERGARGRRRDRGEAGTPKPLLIAVTVLTSLGDADLARRRHRRHRRAAGAAPRAAHRGSGLDGVVCSAVEAPALRAALRTLLQAGHARHPAGRQRGTTRRASSRREAAIANGADYLVIGRPITQAADPVAALAAINAVASERTA